MKAMKTTLAIALAACAVLSAEALGTSKAIKAGAAIAAIGAGALSQVAPAVVAAGLWAPPAHHHHDHHGWESHGHHGHHEHHGHGHHGGYGHEKISHGHGHGYNEFGWASLPSPVVDIGHLLRHVALPPIREVLPRVNIAVPHVNLHHGHEHGWH